VFAQTNDSILLGSDFGHGRRISAIAMTGLAPDFNRLMLAGVKVAVSHDIKLGMAVNTIESRRKMHILLNDSKARKIRP
jgi:hypothetical protein